MQARGIIKTPFVERFKFPSLGDWVGRRRYASTPPTLIIHGELDPLPIESARKWATAMPNARLLELKGIGHFPYVEAPDAFFAAINRFLQGDWPEGTTR